MYKRIISLRGEIREEIQFETLKQAKDRLPNPYLWPEHHLMDSFNMEIINLDDNKAVWCGWSNIRWGWVVGNCDA